MNYFDWFELPPTALLDANALRQAYLKRSRDFHPDFHTQASEQEQQAMLEKASYNNLAFKTLSQTTSRLRSLLEMGGYWHESAQLPASFLMEMMDLNELKADGSPDFQPALQQQKDQLESNFQPLLARFDARHADANDWLALRDYYQRFLYLNKI